METVSASNPEMSWVDDSSADLYELTLLNTYGETVWGPLKELLSRSAVLRAVPDLHDRGSQGHLRLQAVDWQAVLAARIPVTSRLADWYSPTESVYPRGITRIEGALTSAATGRPGMR